jgi:hypothetical protein
LRRTAGRTLLRLRFEVVFDLEALERQLSSRSWIVEFDSVRIEHIRVVLATGPEPTSGLTDQERQPSAAAAFLAVAPVDHTRVGGSCRGRPRFGTGDGRRLMPRRSI